MSSRPRASAAMTAPGVRELHRVPCRSRRRLSGQSLRRLQGRRRSASRASMPRTGGVASVGLRPHTVIRSPAATRGLTSAPTKAMLAAAADKPYTVPFRGTLNFQYAGEGRRNLHPLRRGGGRGRPQRCVRPAGTTKATVEAVVDRIRQVMPAAKISTSRAPTLPSCRFRRSPRCAS